MQIYLLFLLIAFELFSPIMIWKAQLPDWLRYIAIGLLALNLIVGFLSAIRRRRFPRGLVYLAVLAFLGGFNALVQGQSPNVPIWGIWQMFKYPLLCVLIANEEDWSTKIPQKLIKWSLVLILLEVAVQLIQKAMGETDPDQICGTLSRFQWGGQIPLTVLLALLFCFVLGWALVTGKFWPALVALSLSGLAGALGEFKILYFILPFFMGVALLYMMRNNLRRAIAIALVLLIGVGLINQVYTTIQGESPLEYFRADIFDRYFNGYSYSDTQSVYVVGRNYFIQVVWEQISASPVLLMFGMGAGARQESKTLGSVGSSIAEDGFGLLLGPSLSMLLGEYGLSGMAMLLSLYIWVLKTLWQKVHNFSSNSGETASADDPFYHSMVIGLWLFTLLWPIWLWYDQTWTIAIPNLIYFMALGTVLQTRRPVFREVNINAFA